MLRVQLLGEIAAVRDGEPVPLSAPHRRLLAFLALHPGPHERDALAARFWPDAPTPRANLRTAVWALRQALGPDAVRRDPRRPSRSGPVDARPRRRRRAEPAELCAGLDDDWAEAARAEHLRRRIARLDDLARGGRTTRPTPRAGRPAGAPSPRWTSPRTGC